MTSDLNYSCREAQKSSLAVKIICFVEKLQYNTVQAPHEQPCKVASFSNRTFFALLFLFGVKVASYTAGPQTHTQCRAMHSRNAMLTYISKKSLHFDPRFAKSATASFVRNCFILEEIQCTKFRS